MADTDLKSRIQHAREAEEKGQFQKALTHWQKVTASHPNKLQGPLGEIRCYKHLGAFSKACSCAERALKRWPENPALLRHYAQLHKLIGAPEQALAAARKLKRVCPDDPTAARIEILSLLALQSFHEAGRKAETAVLQYPDQNKFRELYIRVWRNLPLTEQSLALSRSWFHDAPDDPIYFQFHLDCLAAFSRASEVKDAKQLHASASFGGLRIDDPLLFQKALDTPPPLTPSTTTLSRRIAEVLRPADMPFSRFEEEAKWGVNANKTALTAFTDLAMEVVEMEGVFSRVDLKPVQACLARGKGCLLVTSHHGPGAAAAWYLDRHLPHFKRIGNQRNLMLSNRQPSDDAPNTQASILIGASPLPHLRQIIRDLSNGHALALACDGNLFRSTLDAPLLNGTVRIWDLPARLNHRLGVPTVWCQAYWDGNKIALDFTEIEVLPRPKDPETHERFWAQRYANLLEDHLRRGPRNYSYSSIFWSRALGL